MRGHMADTLLRSAPVFFDDKRSVISSLVDSRLFMIRTRLREALSAARNVVNKGSAQ